MAALLRQTSLALYGDETILVRDGHVYPYPTRIALAANGSPPDRCFLGANKILVAIPNDRVAQSRKIDTVVFHTSAKFKWLQVLHLKVAIALGLGLPQMKEYLIRRDSIWLLAGIFRQRCRFARSSRFDYAPADIRENVDAIVGAKPGHH